MFVSTGIVITFQSGFMAELLDVTPPAATRKSIETSHQGSSLVHSFTPSLLADWGECGVEMAFAPATSIPINEAAEEVTITFPDSTASVWTFDAFLTNYAPKGPLEDRATASATLKVTGGVTIT